MLTFRKPSGWVVGCLLTLLTLPLAQQPAAAEPISWMERFALATDREAALSELIPGSDDYYFYHCLYYQTSEQLERSEATLRDWVTQHKGRETPVISAMMDRQRLLTYHQTPQRTIDHLVRRLGIKLDHTAPATKNERRFPSKFGSSLITVDRLVNEALRQNDPLKPLGVQSLLERFRKGKTGGIGIKLHDLLGRVTGPYVDRLDELVVQELSKRRPGEKRFGDVRAHFFLTLDELKQVAQRVPEVADDDKFVAAMLLRMRPNADNDPSRQQDVRADYLARVEEYLQTLPPSYAGMQAAAAYRLLESNLQQGIYDRELLERYLRLPRVSPIVHRDWGKRAGTRANLGQDFMSVALLPPIGNEEPVVRAHLEHFLRDAKNVDAFSQYLKPEYLRQVFAETKLLAGIGEEQQWYKMLSAPQRQAIRDKVELRLSVENPREFSVDQPAVLKVDLKNVPEVVIRIYEINTASYYRTHDKRVDTDIDLDGLIATHERKLNFNQSAIVRHAENLELPEIEGRGVWVIDLVGKGVRARALIRRGAIDYVASDSASGMVFTLIDENRKPIPAASMWVSGQQFIADDGGRIVLPPVVDPTTRRAIISDGAIAAQVTFAHLPERYRLTAGMHVDRTLLQSGGESKLVIRPRLMMGETVIDPSTLRDVSVRIVAKDLDDISTTHTVENLEVSQNGELVIPIRVPSRLSDLNVQLSGKIDKLADGRESSVSTSRSWDVAGIRRTSQTHDSFLTRDGADYIVEVRGRNGEPIARATVLISLTTNVRNSPVEQTLQSDDAGQVRLGPLAGVTQIRFSVPGGLQHQRDLNLDAVRWANKIYTVTDRPLLLPLAQILDEVRSRYRLLEVRDGSYVADHSDLLSAADGLLTIPPLDAGDYHLIDRSTAEQTLIAVVSGPAIGSVAVGQTRHRAMSPAVPLGIASITRDDDGWRIQLSGDFKAARVHLYGTRFLDRTSPFSQLDLPLPRLRGRRVALPFSGYVSDLRLGDEYQYVLRRRYAKKFPGVMLPQPSVILNPWETEETSNTSQEAREGEAPPPTAAAPPAPAAESAKKRSQAQSQAVGSDYDFLADPGVIATNLRPDENGVVTIANDVIEGLPILQVIACDPATMVQRTVTSPLKTVETVDLRLAESLDADVPFSFERGVSIASPEEPLDLQSLGSAQVQVYSSVGDLLKLYKTLTQDSRLSDFDELAVWDGLDQEAKLSAYSRLASHELHLFLWFHDRVFFQDIVQPYLANKHEKQFIDRWLLEEDLQRYTKLWRYNQLNAAERALLAMRVPEVRENVQRELRETVAEQDENYAAVRRGIESALRSRKLQRKSKSEKGAVAFGFAMPDAKNWQGLSRRRLSRSKELEESVDAARMEDMAKLGELMFKGRASGDGFRGAGFFRELDSTKQWAESQWDRVRTVGGAAPSSLIDVNPFWRDIANSEGREIAVSTNLLRPIDSRHAALAALAMCGLPLSPGEVGLPTEPTNKYRPAHAVAVVTKRLKRLEPAQAKSSILVGQRFERVNRPSSDDKTDAADPSEFLVGEGYRGHIVVSNPTPQRRTVDLFWQIPSGSLPLAGNQMTDSRTIVLEPFAVQAIEYQFYFPVAGEFTHYPTTVAVDSAWVARGTEKKFAVVSELSKSDTITWESVVISGTAAEIEAFLGTANLRSIDWVRVAHRMKDQEVYKVVMKVLREANLPVPELWAYSFTHRDEDSMRAYLSMRSDLCDRTGPVLNSPLLEVEPIERRTHELLEYAPLVRARIHRLGERDEILNPTFRAQYEQFARVLGFSSEIAAKDRLALAYYLLIQNRISEAIESFQKIDRASVESQLQYDYLHAFLSMHQGQYERAERIAKQHVRHPIPRWSQRFTLLTSQLNQRRDLNETEKLVSVKKDNARQPIAEGSGDLSVMDRELRQARATDLQPEAIVRVEGDSLRIDHRRSKEATLNFYGVDLELLFSKAPFVREDLQRMAMVQPTRTEPLNFESATGIGRFDLDGNLRRQTLLVEVVAGASRSTALYYGGDITTYVSESFGQLQTTDSESNRPISSAYVKVYAKFGDGSVRFHKDGYTDARGRFDYASVSAAGAQGATRYAILVISDEKGATLHDVSAPGK